MASFKNSYGFTFDYRKVENGKPEHERFFFSSNDNDIENACTVSMLQYLTKHGYYSGKITSYRKYLSNGNEVILSYGSEEIDIWVYSNDHFQIFHKAAGTNLNLAFSVFNSVCSMFEE